MAEIDKIKARDINIFKELFISFKYQFRAYAGLLVLFLILSAVLFFLELFIYAVLLGHAALNLQAIVASIKTGFGNASAFFSQDFQIVWYLSVLVAAAFGGSILPKIGSRYSYFLFVQPIRRSSIVMGRCIAAFVCSALVLAVYYICAAFVSFFLFSSVPFSYFFISLAETMLITFAVFAVIVFLGSGSNNPEAASMTSLFLLLFGFYFLLLILPIVYPTMEPWFLLNYAAESTYNGFSSSFQHIVVTNQSIEIPPTLPVVTGLPGIGVNAVSCGGSGYMKALSITFVNDLPEGINVNQINFTLPNGTVMSYPLDEAIAQGGIWGIGVIPSCPVTPSSVYALGTKIVYYPQGLNQPQVSSGTVYINESNIEPNYVSVVHDTYEPYPLESASIAVGYIVFFLSLGMLIYSRREVK